MRKISGGILGCAGVARCCGSNTATGKRNGSGYNEHHRDCRCEYAHRSGRNASRRLGAIGTNLRGHSSQGRGSTAPGGADLSAVAAVDRAIEQIPSCE